MDKVYNPKDKEHKIYELWEKGGFFTPEINSKKKPFTIIMPPPNANGVLHVGHAVFATLEDIMIRWHRMKGDPALWVPGADHAGIATQVSYEKKLKKEGKTRFDLGREEFIRQAYEFSIANREFMEGQLKKLGASCDWTRKKFTLEPPITESVLYTFKKMYEEGLIYRGERITNWCPRCQTALSDLEVKYVEEKTPLYFIKYGPLVLATVRLETKFGDTAVAVNPKDKRYQKYVGKEIEIQTVLGKSKLKVVADDMVDPEFGTGVVKITPAHDPNDFEAGKRHGLKVVQVIGFDGKMNEKAGKYAGMKVLEARKKIAEDMQEMGLMDKIDENYVHTVGTCDRCSAVVEPLVSNQWFVRTEKLAKEAVKAVKDKKIVFIPKHFEKTYFHWMKNIRDWCISRQIWWGHRIPVWYCNGCGEVIVEIQPPVSCPKCGAKTLRQDEDTLDTWFSSGQWPFNVFGWPNKTKDFDYFYPTTVMETGYDILFFWVARMIMMGMYCTGKAPFKYVYLHGLVRDKDKQKMSKSKGNVIDPLNVVDAYGADALRMALVFGTGAGKDVVISEEKIIGQRRFTNKIWNASRFVLSMLGDDYAPPKSKPSGLTKEDKWIIGELNKTIKKVDSNLEKYQFSQAAEEAYNFFWHKFCDKCIEDVKKRLKDKDDKAGKWVLYTVLLDSLKLLHPFTPFITEEIYQRMPKKGKALIVEDWPKAN